MRSIRIKAQAAIDTEWYRRLLIATAGIRETFIMLEPDEQTLAKARDAFFAHDGRINPDLHPQHLDSALIEEAKSELMRLQQDIEAEEKNEYIKLAYMGHISERIMNLEMILASLAGDHASFISKNIDLYGMPDDGLFAATCAWIRQDIQGAPMMDSFPLSGLRDELLRLLPDMPGDISMLLPPSSVFSQVRDMHFRTNGYFDQLFAPAGLSTEPYIEQWRGDEITTAAIANVGSDYTVTPAADGLWAVLSSSRQVVRPAGYRVDRDYFSGVIAHEIGSHLLEEANGSRQSLELLGLGLSGFEKGNEGRAYLREQIIYPTESVFTRQPSWEYILMLHLSVSLAAGLHNRPYAFTELFEVLHALHRYWRERRYPLDTNNEAEAREEAWLLSVRIMKGTDGTGGCYMKDIVYLEGNIGCWKIAEKQGPEAIFVGDVGKFNVTDPDHLDILAGLGILP